MTGQPSVVERAVEAMRAGANQYAPGIGTPDLRRRSPRHQWRHYGLELDPEREVVVTTGATEGIAAALLGLVDPGDEVVVLEPYYDSYVAMIAFAGGVRRPVTLRAPDFRLDVDELRAAVTGRTRVLLVNTPHNPTGTVLTRAELEAIAEVAIEHDLVVVTDEVYEHLVFDDHEHVPLCTLPGMAERTVTLSSAGKMLLLHRLEGRLGDRPGRPRGCGPRREAVADLHHRGAPLQPAVAHALEHEAGFHGELATELQKRRDLLCTGLAGLDSTYAVPEGTYFATTDVRRSGWRDGMEFCLALPERAGVVAIPAQAFYDDLDAGDGTWCGGRSARSPRSSRTALRRLQAADLHA